MATTERANLARLANEHWRAAYRVLINDVGGQWRRFGAVDAFTSDIPLSFASGCLIIDPADPADLERAIEWVVASGMPFRIRLDSSLSAGLLDVAPRLGLVREEWLLPGLTLSPLPTAPVPAHGVTTRRVDPGSYLEFIALLVDTGLPRLVARRAFPESMLDLSEIALFTAALDGTPAGTAVLVRTSNDVAGIYTVGTVEAARRRGVGTAATWAAVEQANEWGCSTVVLQATEMGLPIYRSMGFEVVVDYVSYAPRPAQPATSQVTQ